MNSIVVLPLAGAPTLSAIAGDALTRKPTKEELYAYAEWLSNEHGMLIRELGEPDRFSPVGTAARAFHYPSGDRTWEDVPKPSTRCLSVFGAIGVDASKSDWMARGDASKEPDPIFAAIEAHKVARATWVKCVDDHAELEDELPPDKRKSSICAFEEEIVATDDPRWIESERAINRESDADYEAAVPLVSVQPTTLGGIAALLNYATAADTDGEGWPQDLISDDGEKRRSWHYFLIENIGTALTDIGA